MRSEGHFIIFPARFLCCLGLRLDLQLQHLDEADRRRDVIEDEQAFPKRWVKILSIEPITSPSSDASKWRSMMYGTSRRTMT